MIRNATPKSFRIAVMSLLFLHMFSFFSNRAIRFASDLVRWVVIRIACTETSRAPRLPITPATCPRKNTQNAIQPNTCIQAPVHRRALYILPALLQKFVSEAFWIQCASKEDLQ